MNLRHGVAFALLGWYLMVPPLDRDGRLLVNAPLSQWQTTWGLDSARQCAVLSDLRDDAKTDSTKQLDIWIAAKKAGHKLSDSQQQDLARSYTIRVVSEQIKCIASDDPRLKEK